jgi:hypothetical protein
MEHSTTAHAEHHDSGTKEIWRTFWILINIDYRRACIGILDDWKGRRF